MKQKQVVKLNESQLRNIIKESIDEVLNSDLGQGDSITADAYLLRDKAMEAICSINNTKALNLICYLLNPEHTAIGAGFTYNNHTLIDLFNKKSLDIARRAQLDKNFNFTYKQVLEKAKNGEFDC